MSHTTHQRGRAPLIGAVAMLFVVSKAFAAPQAEIDTGRLQGAMHDDVVYFKGIPFAQPPIGSLRWKPPQPVSRWKGVRKAIEYGADCTQKPWPPDWTPSTVTPAEDCLYLNVWAPAKPVSRKLPVMVWIYGGGFVNGGSSPSGYDGSEFARDGVVLVSFNYRLGRLGFFAHPALSAEQPDGPLVNYGLMDQLAALQWVKRNIAAFGGDPQNVTVFGESAGGMSVFTLLTTPLAEGLFQKAIIESGGGGAAGGPNRPLRGSPNSAEAVGMEFAKRAGIEGDDAGALSRLRALPAQRFTEDLNMSSIGTAAGYVGGPIMDGRIVTGAPLELFAAGKGARVPVMIGATSLDLGFVRANTLEELFAPFGANAARARKLYDPQNSNDVRAVAMRVAGDQAMVEPARRTARILSSRGQPVYQFRFSYVAGSLRKMWEGAMHASELHYVFNTMPDHYGKDLTAQDAEMARKMHAYWVAFAKTGKPDVAGLPAWPAYDPAKDIIMDFTNEGPIARRDPRHERLDLIDQANGARSR